jgi:hypothetical protein
MSMDNKVQRQVICGQMVKGTPLNINMEIGNYVSFALSMKDEKGKDGTVILHSRHYSRLIRNNADLRKWVGLELIETLKLIKHVCEEPDCNIEGIQCHLSYYSFDSKENKEAYSYYCPEHATKNGYCWMCGEFWAGNEEFDLDPSQPCPNCNNEVDAETVELDPEEAWWFE